MKKKLIEKHVLINIQRYGKTSPDHILKKVLGENPSLKKNIKELLKDIAQVMKDVKKLSQKDLAKKFARLPHEEKKKEAKTLPELKQVPGPYTFRFEPSPTGPLHLGHMIPLLLNAEYAKRYNGMLVVRIADTNPGDVYDHAYDFIKDDVEWATGQTVKLVLQSQRMDDYYLHAKMLLDDGHAYVCECGVEQFRTLLLKKKACPCRGLVVEEHQKRWKKMFTEYDMGKAVLRIKTDVRHKNPAVRDWPAFRINDTPHPRCGTKYRVWPLMNFSVAVDDHEDSISHVIRGKDHVVNMERQLYLFNYFQWNIPEYIHIGRLNFEGMKISTSLFREGVESKEYMGWDDPRLPTLLAFRRRGLQPGAFVKYIHELGPSKVDKTVKYQEFIKTIYAFNRGLIDKTAKRYFFVESPQKVKIMDAPVLKVEVPSHPEVQGLGKRHFRTGESFYIEDKLSKDMMYRFMHLFNFKNKQFHSVELQPSLKARLIHWLPADEKMLKVKVVMYDGTIKHGFGEYGLGQVKEGDMVQFERKFYCRFDEKLKDTLMFYCAHP
jgi:glutamyl-tRNA synthetase